MIHGVNDAKMTTATETTSTINKNKEKNKKKQQQCYKKPASSMDKD